jgi:TP901 family phage tail tape measure protein
MASKYSIEAVFNLIDRVSAPTSRAGKALDKLGIKSKAVSNALKRDFDKAAASINKIGASAAKFAKKALLGLIPAGIGVGLLTKQFIEFDDALHKAGSVFSDLNPLADDFKTKLDAIGKAARDVAAATEFDAVQTMQALKVMATAGIKTEQAISLLPHVADMATAAGVDLDEAVGMAAGALNVFGKMTDDPLKLAENFQYVSDIMVRGANLANMSISDMSAAVSAGGARFKEANQRIEDFGAAVDILASVDRIGSEAGKAIGAIMTQLAAKPGDVSKALQELGIRTQDAQGNMLNFVDIIGQLNVAMKGMGTAKQDEYLFRIFGKNRMDYARPLIEAGVEGFRAYSRELDSAAGSTAKAAEVMRQSIKNKLAVLGSAATEMGFKFVEAFKDKAVTAIESATTAIENFDVAPLVEMASAAADGIMKFVGMLAGAVKTAWQFRYVIIAIAAPIAAYNVALMGITIATGIFNKVMAISRVITGTVTGFQIAYGIVIQKNAAATAALAFVTNEARIATALWGGVMKAVTVIQAKLVTLVIAARNGTLLFIAAAKIKTILLMMLTKGTLAQSGALAAMAVANKTATVSQWLLNAAMNANPIGLAVTAIAALVGIIAALVKWGYKAAAVFITIATIFTGPVGLAIGFVISAVVELIQNLDQVKQAFKDNGFIGAILRIGGVLFSGILAPVQGLLEILSNIPGLGHLAGKGAEKLEELRNFLKGIDDATIIAEVDTPETVEAEITPPVPGSPPLDYPDFGIPGIGSAPGAGGRSKLHGVVDISGGAIPTIDNEGSYTITSAINNASAPGTATSALTSYVISIAATLKSIDGSVSAIARRLPPEVRAELPAMTSPATASNNVINFPMPDTGNSYTTTSVINNTVPPLPPAMPAALTSSAISIAAALKSIDGSVSAIARRLPPEVRAELPAMTSPATATRTNLSLPRVNMGGNDGSADYYNPRNMPPITQVERTAYNIEERIQRLVIEVAAEKGTSARIARAPRDADIRLVNTGGNA